MSSSLSNQNQNDKDTTTQQSTTAADKTNNQEDTDENHSIQDPARLILDGDYEADNQQENDGSFKSDPDVVAALVSLGASMAAVDVAASPVESSFSKKKQQQQQQEQELNEISHPTFSRIKDEDTIQLEPTKDDDDGDDNHTGDMESDKEKQQPQEQTKEEEEVKDKVTLLEEPAVVVVAVDDETTLKVPPPHDHQEEEDNEFEDSVVVEDDARNEHQEEVCAIIEDSVIVEEESGQQNEQEEVCAVIDEPVVVIEDSIMNHTNDDDEVCAVIEESSPSSSSPPVVVMDDYDDRKEEEVLAVEETKEADDDDNDDLVEMNNDSKESSRLNEDYDEAYETEKHTNRTEKKFSNTPSSSIDEKDDEPSPPENLKKAEMQEFDNTLNHHDPQQQQQQQQQQKHQEEGKEKEEPSAAAGDEETTLDEEDDDDEDDYDYENDDDDDEEDPMPLFKYSRLLGSLPRLPKNVVGNTESMNAFSSALTCAALGRVVLLPEASAGTDAPGGTTSATAASSTTTTTSASTSSTTQPSSTNSNNNNNGGSGGPNGSSRNTDASLLRQHFIFAMGFENGQVHLIDADGNAIVPKEQLIIKEWSISYQNSTQKQKRAIVDLCFDASGTHLAAINASGTCAVWEFNWISSSDKNTASTSTTISGSNDGNMLSFLGMSTGGGSGGGSSSSATNTNDQTQSSSSSSAMIRSTSVQVSRITYPSSLGTPVCLAIDPSYKRRREKAVLVGFNDGRLILTKKGFFNRRNDAIIYQGSAGAIQGLAWRGQLVAWADGAGLRLFDVETMSRIATIDRPSGARVSLYPALSSLKPTIHFETSHELLCAWGDCVLCISIKEQTVPARGSTAAAGSGNPDQVVRKRHVECTMAWELDCVACGVAPLDEEHIVILGLVIPETQDDDEGTSSEEQQRVSLMPASSQTPGVNLEVQVISRSLGTVQHSDQLPLLKIPGSANMAEAGAGYTLLSSFVLPRMDDTIEAEEESYLQPEQQDFEFHMTLFSGNETPTAFKDPHLKWNMSELSFDDEKDGDHDDKKDETKGAEVSAKDDEKENDDDSDSQSVDSEDYSFLFRPPKANVRTSTSRSTDILPPIMMVASFSDAVIARTRDIDDAVDHAFSCGKKALALKRGLQYKRELRRYDIDDLTNEYLDALLRRNSADDEDEENKKEEDEEDAPTESVSIRRVRLATRALPILLGGNVPAWVRWISIFSDYPGALFVLKDYVPVRDPKLPPHVYERMLEKMLLEVESMITPDLKDDLESLRLYQEAKDHFLNALVAWGSSHTIREHIKYYSYQDGGHRRKRRLGVGESIPHPRLAPTEQGLVRRMSQTAAGYLMRGAPLLLPPTPGNVPLLDAEDDSLYDVDMVLSGFSSLVPMLLPPEEKIGMEGIAPEKTNTHVALEALAELYIAKHMYERALQCYLIIGSMHSEYDMSDVIKDAISLVNSSSAGDKDKGDKQSPVQHRQYMNVIALIEYRTLHRCLLEEEFISQEQQLGSSSYQALSPPLIAFIGLIGLDSAAEFLMEHCAPAVPTPTRSSGTPGGTLFFNHSSKSSTTLPINLVANGLRSKPELLHWYLDLMFKRKPELYVKFTNTFVPPAEIRELHRTHLDLYVEYANEFEDSAKFLSTMKSSSTAEEMETPLLKFLKALLPLGGVRPDDVKRLLESKRAGKDGGLLEILERRNENNTQVKFPHMFALELAYIMEHFRKEDEVVDNQMVDGAEGGTARELEAKQILMLYLEGAKSLPQAVFYAQRNTDHSSQLWEILVDHCLRNQAPPTPSRRRRKASSESTDTSGTLFGSLLEAAAQSGADLARLVKEIPQGMPVEGLRPRLVGAVADYRWKLQMHQASAEILSTDKVALLRELNNRTRRGMRFHQQQVPRGNNQIEDEKKIGEGDRQKEGRGGSPIMWLAKSTSPKSSPSRKQQEEESKIQFHFDHETPPPTSQETSSPSDSKQTVLRRPVERVPPNRTPFSLPVR